MRILYAKFAIMNSLMHDFCAFTLHRNISDFKCKACGIISGVTRILCIHRETWLMNLLYYSNICDFTFMLIQFLKMHDGG